MQGKNTNIIIFKATLLAFVSKLDKWKRKVRINNFMFEELSLIVMTDDEEQMHADLEILDFVTFDNIRIKVDLIFSGNW